jgi:hypothetical protein
MNIATSVDTTIIKAINTNVSLSQSLLANTAMRRILADLRFHAFLIKSQISLVKSHYIQVTKVHPVYPIEGRL